MSDNIGWFKAMGLHSNIPECCVDWYCGPWQNYSTEDCLAFWSGPGKGYNYAPCPKCLESKIKISMHICTIDCIPWMIRTEATFKRSVNLCASLHMLMEAKGLRLNEVII